MAHYPIIDDSDYYAHDVERSLSGAYQPHGAIADAQCVIAAAFGCRRHNEVVTPGLSNQDMAAFIEHLPVTLPLLAQHEIALALPPIEPTTPKRFIISQPRAGVARLDTTEFLDQCRQLMQSRGFDRALLVAHPYHITWVDYICRQLSITIVVPTGLDAIRFDEQSEQYWTRSVSAWQSEVLARQASGDSRRISRSH